MTDPVAWKDVNGKQVLFINFKGLKGEPLITAIARTMEFFEKTPPNKKEFLPILVDVQNSVIDSKAMEKFKAMTKGITGYKHKTAVLGVTAAKKVLMNAINFLMGQEMQGFNTIDEAFDWLFSTK